MADPSTSLSSIHASLVSSFSSGCTLPLEARRETLLAIRSYLRTHESSFISAHHADLHKPYLETLLYDLGPIILDIEHMLANLTRLARPHYCERRVLARVAVEPHPKGVILILGPFNFPLQLILRQMVAAIAAGNVVCVKPSEMATKAEQFMTKLGNAMDDRVIRVVTGGVEVSQALLKLRWDHIMFTGSGRVGKIIMKAAAEWLTPVTLELGGKCPALITKTADIRTAARSVIKGRFVNCGQVCLASDYCLVEESIYDEFVKELVDAVRDFYGEDVKKATNYGRLISEGHWKRVVGMLKESSGNVLCGGEYDDSDGWYVAPTVVEVEKGDSLLQDEVFGPLLAVVKVKDVEEMVGYVNKGDIPLALYLFCNDKDIVEDVVRRTRSGSAGVNETVYQVCVPGSYLGGVGESGMGGYGFDKGFETFSHMRPVMYSSPFWSKFLEVIQPKFLGERDGGWQTAWLEKGIRAFGKMPLISFAAKEVDQETGQRDNASLEGKK